MPLNKTNQTKNLHIQDVYCSFVLCSTRHVVFWVCRSPVCGQVMLRKKGFNRLLTLLVYDTRSLYSEEPYANGDLCAANLKMDPLVFPFDGAKQ